jgi:hypothetical protein
LARSAVVGFVILGVLALIGIIEVPTGDMTMADVTSSNNKDMEMDNSMNMEMEMDMGNTINDNDNYMQMNMDTNGNDMVMNMK